MSKTSSITINQANDMFPRLYKYSNTNKVNQWHIAIEPNSHGYKLVTTYGEVGGKQTVATKIVSEGKAGRSKLDQAILETKSKWSNKKNKETYCEELQEKNSTIRPMLAQTYVPPPPHDSIPVKTSRAYKMPNECYVQPKLDGLRCIAYLHDGNVRLESRKGIEFHNMEHIKEQLTGVFANDPRSGLFLDGELYTDELEFEEICGFSRLHLKDIPPERIRKIQYHIYDLYYTTNTGLSFDERHSAISHLFKNIPVTRSTVIRQVHTERVKSKDDVLRLHGVYIEHGFEGIMLRDPVGIYEPNKRSRYLQKYKEFLEEEFEIVGYHDGEGVEKGLVVWDCVTPSKEYATQHPQSYIKAVPGRRFSVRPRGNHERRRELFYEAENYIGSQITVIFQEYTADGVPRFPVGKAIRDIY